jgi:predicted transposase YbfD/YdcC
MGLPTDPRHSWSFIVVQSAIALADREPASPPAPATVAGACDDLLKLFSSVSDGRSGQGRDHPVAAGAGTGRGSGGGGDEGLYGDRWLGQGCSAPVLADLYMRAGAGPAPPPSRATIWRVVTDADAEAFDATAGKWLMSGLPREPAGRDGTANAGQDGTAGSGPDEPATLMPIRLDGKTVRGAKDAAGNQRHLLAALVGCTAQSSVVAAQAEVGVKTNEVRMAKVVLGQIDLNGKLVTADALHAVKATAEFIRGGGGEFVLPVKENRKTLFDALDALPWHQVPIAHSATDRGHGRITTRTIQVMPAPEDLPFPHVSQVLLIERYVSDLAGKPVSAVAAFGVASPSADQVSAADLAHHVRGQWAIESLHWLRDTLYQEDKSQVRTRSGPRIMAALRNLAICALCLFGRTGHRDVSSRSGISA